MPLIPRNSFVLLRLKLPDEKIVGKIVTSAQQDAYAVGEVLAVGPGTIAASGGVSETHDLHNGDSVYVKARQQVPSQVGGVRWEIAGVEVPTGGGEEKLYLFAEHQIVAIISKAKELN
jgi:co-chaperonin GroES (HSP10)